MNTDQTVITYSIMDPTGNITALVESRTETERQPSLAAEIMRLHPEVEQVGFVRFPEDDLPELRMAAGEFCGNASMCAAALYLRGRKSSGKMKDGYGAEECLETVCFRETVRLRASGAEEPVEVSLTEEAADAWAACIKMPSAVSVEDHRFPYGETTDVSLPLVRLQGISHVIIEEMSPAFRLSEDLQEAENAVKEWHGLLQQEGIRTDGLGLIFLKKKCPEYKLTPLVYVPGAGTVFWENACASGTAAAAVYLAKKAGRKISCSFKEPGGVLAAKSDPLSGRTSLSGTVRLIGTFYHSFP